MPASNSKQKKTSKTSKGMELKKGGSIDRIGRAVRPDKRDPDIDKMVKEVSVPTKLAKGGMPKKGKRC